MGFCILLHITRISGMRVWACDCLIAIRNHALPSLVDSLTVMLLESLAPLNLTFTIIAERAQKDHNFLYSASCLYIIWKDGPSPDFQLSPNDYTLMGGRQLQWIWGCL